tara:strand:+ start:318 stop:740 length:423 start_codon:yes stop_codon:yes gene_type:complete
LRRGEINPYGQSAERWISQSDDAPSRHCLSRINRGREMLICAHHPFSALQPDAETGPILLCADAYLAFPGTRVPTVFNGATQVLIKAYGPDEHIIYGAGAIIKTGDIKRRTTALLQTPDVQFADIRSACNKCWLACVLPQ